MLLKTLFVNTTGRFDLQLNPWNNLEQQSVANAIVLASSALPSLYPIVNAIMTMVQTLGFPIVCCGALFWRMMKESDNHKVEMEKVTDALNNNTRALIRLEESLKGEKEK